MVFSLKIEFDHKGFIINLLITTKEGTGIFLTGETSFLAWIHTKECHNLTTTNESFLWKCQNALLLFWINTTVSVKVGVISLHECLVDHFIWFFFRIGHILSIYNYNTILRRQMKFVVHIFVPKFHIIVSGGETSWIHQNTIIFILETSTTYQDSTEFL